MAIPSHSSSAARTCPLASKGYLYVEIGSDGQTTSRNPSSAYPLVHSIEESAGVHCACCTHCCIASTCPTTNNRRDSPCLPSQYSDSTPTPRCLHCASGWSLLHESTANSLLLRASLQFFWMRGWSKTITSHHDVFPPPPGHPHRVRYHATPTWLQKASAAFISSVRDAPRTEKIPLRRLSHPLSE